jgi:hypothetical protein
VSWFISDDGYGIWETDEGKALLESHALTLSAHHLGLGPPPETVEKLSVEEKRENLVAHFSALADLEERRGGVSHFRLILSVGREVSIEQLKALVNAYLRENFPLCSAFVAIHDDTEHRHAHVYVHARQLNQHRIELGQDYFKLDERWMSICAAQLGDPKIYEVHMKLKEQTLEWKKGEKKARERGEAIPPKPDRWGDHHETVLVFRPFDDRWCGRLQAQTRVAETKVAWLEAARAKAEDVTAARAAAAALRERLGSAAERRSNSKRESKRQLPPEIITVREARELKGYERDLREVEKGREANLRQTVVPERVVTQAVLGFEEPVAARESQTGFNFNTSPPLAPPTSLTTVAKTQTLPDKEAGQLVVNLELARARTIFLRSEERNFAVMAHQWVSPVSGRSLRGVEHEIKDKLKQKKGFTDLGTLREQLQNELAEERRSLPHRRAEAEAEVKALSARLAGELSARRDRGISAPAARFTEQQLHELIEHAETSRDTGLLERIYKIESDQAMGNAQATGDPEIIRRLEEKYAGLKLKAEVGLRQSEKSLAWAHQHSTEILLPARDTHGKDIAVSLDQYEPQKGLRGVLEKLTDRQGRREMRSRLETVKDTYLAHRASEVKTQAAYLRALRVVAKDCHELSRGYGYPAPAAPALTTKEIADIRAYAVSQPEGIGKPWLQQCGQAQALLDNWNAKPYRARKSADKTTPQAEERDRTEKIQQELQEQRQRQERMEPIPLRVVVPREPPISLGRERSDPDAPKRGGRWGR